MQPPGKAKNGSWWLLAPRRRVMLHLKAYNCKKHLCPHSWRGARCAKHLGYLTLSHARPSEGSSERYQWMAPCCRGQRHTSTELTYHLERLAVWGVLCKTKAKKKIHKLSVQKLEIKIKSCSFLNILWKKKKKKTDFTANYWNALSITLCVMRV